MDRGEQIEAVIDSLQPEDYSRIARWFRERDQAAWDQQLDDDSASGRLDFLFAEADEEGKQGLLKEWPTG
jgi:hypothetical protein